MHEKRNFILVLIGTASLLWAIWAWTMSESGFVDATKLFPTLITLAIAGFLIYAFNIEDQLPDRLEELVGSHYFEADGVCLLPVVRASPNGPELSIYYQNRFENPASVIVHLRPAQHSFTVVQDATDVHIAFRVGGGDVMVGVSHYPRSHGTRWRRHEGHPCGSMDVDWVGNAMKIGAHEVDGTIELRDPVMLHLCMPENIEQPEPHNTSCQQEIL